jgi:hypothetical protein
MNPNDGDAHYNRDYLYEKGLLITSKIMALKQSRDAETY